MALDIYACVCDARGVLCLELALEGAQTAVASAQSSLAVSPGVFSVFPPLIR